MSLDWNAATCPAMQKVWEWDAAQGGFDNLTNEDFDTRKSLFALDFARLDDLIWASLVMDVGTLTEANLQTATKRLYIAMQMNLWGPVGYYKNDDPEQGFIGKDSMPSVRQVYERVSDYVGLRVNISPTTDAQWWKRIRKQFEDDVQRSINRVLTQNEKATA